MVLALAGDSTTTSFLPRGGRFAVDRRAADPFGRLDFFAALPIALHYREPGGLTSLVKPPPFARKRRVIIRLSNRFVKPAPGFSLPLTRSDLRGRPADYLNGRRPPFGPPAGREEPSSVSLCHPDSTDMSHPMGCVLTRAGEGR